MRKPFVALLFGLALTGVAVGCGSSNSTTKSHATTSVAASRSAVSSLIGSYVRTVTKADIARTNSFRHNGPNQGTAPTGVYHLTFTASTFRAADPNGFAVPQTYSATDQGRLSVILYVNPSQASFCGPDVPQNAAYQWSLSHSTLTLNAKDDGCADRGSILQGQWTRIGS